MDHRTRLYSRAVKGQLTPDELRQYLQHLKDHGASHVIITEHLGDHTYHCVTDPDHLNRLTAVYSTPAYGRLHSVVTLV